MQRKINKSEVNDAFQFLYTYRTEGTTLEEPCSESTDVDRVSPWRRTLWRAVKVYIGPVLLFLAYSFGGAALFHHLESQNELDALGK